MLSSLRYGYERDLCILLVLIYFARTFSFYFILFFAHILGPSVSSKLIMLTTTSAMLFLAAPVLSFVLLFPYLDLLSLVYFLCVLVGTYAQASLLFLSLSSRKIEIYFRCISLDPLRVYEEKRLGRANTINK